MSDFLYTLMVFLVLLTILVFVHEWGHFYVARRFGVRVEVFSIGFGREIYGWTDKRGTRWKIAAVPLGGYVKFFGDANAASMPADDMGGLSREEVREAFPYKPLYQRAAIVAAGPLINLAFAVLLFAGLYMTSGQPFLTSEISAVEPGSAAEAADIRAGDVITSINDLTISTFQEMGAAIVASKGQPLNIIINREGQTLAVVAVPRLVDAEGKALDRPMLGVRGGGVGYDRLGPFSALYQGTITTGRTMGAILVVVGELFRGERSTDELGGPLRIAQISGEAASLGLVSFIRFMALISINLGLVNLFPIPLLDGGHLMFYGFEALRGKPLGARMQEIGYMIGFAIVIGLLLLVTWNDLGALGLWQNLG